MASQKSNRSVRKIHNNKLEKGKRLFLVEWHSYPKKSQWEWHPECDLIRSVNFRKYLQKSKLVTKKKVVSKKSAIAKNMLGEEKSERKSLSPSERMDLIFNQNFQCSICLENLSRAFEVDHIIPLQYNGSNDLENLQALCPRCHIFKSSSIDRNMPQIVKKFKEKGIVLSKHNLATEIRVRFMIRNRILPPHQNKDMLLFKERLKVMFEKSCQEQLRNLTDYFVRNTTSVFTGMYQQMCQPPSPVKIVEEVKPQKQISKQNLLLRKILIQIREMVQQRNYFGKMNLTPQLDLYIHLGDGEKTRLNNSFPMEILDFFKESARQKKKDASTKLIAKRKIDSVSLLLKEN